MNQKTDAVAVSPQAQSNSGIALVDWKLNDIELEFPESNIIKKVASALDWIHSSNDIRRINKYCIQSSLVAEWKEKSKSLGTNRL
jgi:hypothetical protein